jgi:uncharacterized protein YjbI with pentapeptide repeats
MSNSTPLKTFSAVTISIRPTSFYETDQTFWALLNDSLITPDQSLLLRQILNSLDTSRINPADGTIDSVASEEQKNEIAPLEIAFLSRSVLAGVNLSTQEGEQPVQLSHASCLETNLSASDMSGVLFRYASLLNAQLVKATLVGTNFAHAGLFKADLSHATATGASFEHANLISAIAVELQGDRANFQHADLTAVNLEGASLQEANFSDADLFRANCGRAHMKDAKFIGANLMKTDFRGADLTGAIFTDAFVMDADFTGATILPHQLTVAQALSAKGLPKGFLEAKDVTPEFLEFLEALAAQGRTQL